MVEPIYAGGSEGCDELMARATQEPNQIALGKYLRQQGAQTGDYLLFQKPPIARVG
jgi:hypothetical protein